MLKNVLFTILLLLSSILGVGGVLAILNSIIDDRRLDPATFLIGLALILLWTGTCAIMETKYFTKQRKAWLRFFGLTANKK